MKKKLMMMIIGAAVALFAGTSALAAEMNYEIEVFNNVGKKDVVVVSGLEPKSSVSVYNDKNILLGKKTAGSSSTEVSVSLKLPNADGGEIKVAVLEKGAEDASIITAEYPAKPVTEAPAAGDVTISNNVDKKAGIYIENLEPKDTVTVYSEAGKKLASGKVSSKKDEITLSCKQLTKEAGKLFITVKSANKLESERTAYSYDAQEVTKVTSYNEIEITNNVGKKGTIEVTGFDTGSTLTVYNENGKKIGSGRYSSSKDLITVSVNLNKAGGSVDLVLKEANKLPSDNLTVQYDGQPQTDKIGLGEIDVTANPTGIKDEIYIEGLESGDIVKVYSSQDGKSTVLKGTVGSNSDGVINLTKSSLGTGGTKLWISNTRKGMLESDRIEITVPKVETSDTVVAGNADSGKNTITVTNNAGMSGSVYVKDLVEGSVITVYNKEKSGSKLGSATVASGGDFVNFSVSQLAKNGGEIWVSRKDPGKNESARVPVSYDEQIQTVFGGDEIDVVNNSGTAGIITVGEIENGDVVKVYSSSTGTSSIASGTCGSGGSVSISTTKLSAKGGVIYLTLTTPGYLESKRVEVTYAAENASDPVPDENVTITNNTGVASSITVTGLYAGETISAYSSASSTAAIGTGTVAANYSSVTFNVQSLKADGGELYITRKSSGCAESERVKVSYGEVAQTEEMNGSVTILNNSGAQGTVTVKGLSSGEVVKVYKTETISASMGSGTASSDGSVSINVPQLDENGGSLYITVTAPGKTESNRVKADYLPQSSAPLKSEISVVNNVTIDSVVTVTGLTGGDVVSVYSSSSATTPVGMATASGSMVEIKVGQLSALGGNVYVTVTSPERCESSRTVQSYTAQKTTSAPTNATIANKKDDNATVYITGLEANDYIRVYSDAYGSTLLGSATAGGSELIFQIVKLGDSAGTVYISRTSLGKNESPKTAFQYSPAN